MKSYTAVLVIVLVCIGAWPARAQDSVRDVLSFLLTNQSVATGDFVKDRQAAAQTRDTVSRFLLVELATLPISSSSGGFAYKLNRSLGTVERASESFGPFFTERAITAGRGETSLGLTYRYSRFDKLDGRKLRDGTIVTTANRFSDEAAAFDVEALALRIETSTFTLFGNYGVTDRLDLGVAVPVVSLRLAGERTNTYRGNTFLQARASAFVTGLADVALRAKYSALQTGNFGLAGNADLRLPTGTEENLLGAGRAAIRLSGVATVERGRIGSHLTGGFARGGVSDEWDWGGALVAAATPRISVSGELMGRHLDALARIAEVTAPHPLIIGVETTRLLPSTTGTNTLFALAGFKWNIASTWLLNASLLFPLSDVGLTARVTPSIALDYTLSR